MFPVLVKEKRKIKGFINQRSNGQFYFVFGTPSQASYIAWDCDSIEHGIQCIKNYSKI